jgi:hypothetical protein
MNENKGCNYNTKKEGKRLVRDKILSNWDRRRICDGYTKKTKEKYEMNKKKIRSIRKTEKGEKMLMI